MWPSAATPDHNFSQKGKLNRELGVKFQEVVHAKESWEDWVDEDPKTPSYIQRMNYHSELTPMIGPELG